MTGKRGDAFSSGGISDEHKVDELLSGLLSLWDEAARKAFGDFALLNPLRNRTKGGKT